MSNVKFWFYTIVAAALGTLAMVFCIEFAAIQHIGSAVGFGVITCVSYAVVGLLIGMNDNI